MNAKRNAENLASRSKDEIQTKLEHYAAQGYRLASTTSTMSDSALYVHLFFEKDQ
ncbi:DUF4177 domain-containing protein [Fibrella aquatilis]|nr:DUF4177 domain-containing protein [Fibrella aquatilis]